jgi:outer membrane protein
MQIAYFSKLLKGLTLALLLLSSSASAFEQGDWLVRIRGIDVYPSSRSSTVHTKKLGYLKNSHIHAKNSGTAELDFTYMWTSNIGTELILATDKHCVVANKELATTLGTKHVASTWVLPPTLLLQYHFFPCSAFQPYIGAGVNYTLFYNKKCHTNHSYSNIQLSNSWGVACQVGFDYLINCDWFLNADVKYITMDTTARLKGGILGHGAAGDAKTHLRINPWVFGLGIGKRF